MEAYGLLHKTGDNNESVRGVGLLAGLTQKSSTSDVYTTSSPLKQHLLIEKSQNIDIESLSSSQYFVPLHQASTATHHSVVTPALTVEETMSPFHNNQGSNNKNNNKNVYKPSVINNASTVAEAVMNIVPFSSKKPVGGTGQRIDMTPPPSSSDTYNEHDLDTSAL